VLKQDLNCFCNKSAGKRRVQAFLFELIKLGKTGFLNRGKFNLRLMQTPSRPQSNIEFKKSCGKTVRSDEYFHTDLIKTKPGTRSFFAESRLT